MIDIVVRGPYPAGELAQLSKELNVRHLLALEELNPPSGSISPGVRAVITLGSTGLSGEQMRQFPDLDLITVRGAGSEKVDLPAAASLGITVKTGQGANAFSVADHAVAILLAAIRDVPGSDRAARVEDWIKYKSSRRAPSLLYQKNVGILGLGSIGNQIARRLSGFEVTIAYHNRSPRPEATHAYYPDVHSLANWADILVVSCPGGPSTHHIINHGVLLALGPTGVLVNVGRGTAVDNSALGAALRSGHIAKAAVDVIEGEPEIPTDLKDAPNLIITPHMGSHSPEAEAATHQRVVENVRQHFRSSGLVLKL